MTNEEQQIQRGAQELGLALTHEQTSAIVRYLDILEVTNRSFNLTRIPREEYVTLHVLDSLATFTAMPTTNNIRILDIGTGAGFPGVPLAAALPNAHVTLLDSTLKKVRFAAESAATCGIMNCEGVHQRAESLAQSPQHRGRYDVVVSRAVAAFDVLIQWMAPFVAPGGHAIALKGSKVHEELEGTESLVHQLRFGPPTVHSLTLPGTSIERYFIVAQKRLPGSR